MINISSEVVTSINGSVSSAVQSLFPVLVVLISVPLAFFAIRKIIFFITLAKR